MLDRDLGADEVPAIADENTITWSLGKRIGDAVEYRDESGRPFKARLVAMLNNSVLHGSVIVAQRQFKRRYPSTAGQMFFLIDTSARHGGDLSARLDEALKAQGLGTWPCAEQLARLSAVERTYLDIFGVLGAMGMLLGTVGLGAVVVRNVLERRGELAAMAAMGFTGGRIAAMLMAEHALLLAAGVGAGLACAMLSLAPVLSQADVASRLGDMLASLAGIAIAGMLCAAAGAWWALRGGLLPSLRSE
jgi:hypothetical protein